MSVKTVTGRPLAADYDLVLVHEHLLIDLSWSLSADAPLADAELTPQLAAELADPRGCRDNLVLDDPALAAAELSDLARIRTLIVDVTPDSMGRDPRGLAQIAAAAGVDVVMGGGPCILPSEDPAPRPAEEWARSILDGLDRTDVPQALIGEIGTSDPITEAERSSLIGAIHAQRERGVPLYVYLDPFGRRGVEVLSLIDRHGGDLARTVLCHLDGQIPQGLDYHRELLERGCSIGFDVWGHEQGPWPTDAERVAATLELIELGYAERLLHSHDVCMKTQLRRFGGTGYDHLWRTIRPAFVEAGVPADTIHQLLAGNALQLLRGSTTQD